MTQTVDAVYQNGSFRLLRPKDVPLREGQNVRITIDAEESNGEILALAANVYEGLSQDKIAEIEDVALDRDTFFGESK